MPSEATRVGIAIVLIMGMSVGAAWTYTHFTGPVAPSTPAFGPDAGVYLVEYHLQQQELRLDAKTFTVDGVVTWDAIPVPFLNVTKVDVTLEVTMVGPSAGDDYTVEVADPAGKGRTANHAVSQPSSQGYVRSSTVITWHRANPPLSEPYETDQRAEAARRAAANHTDRSAQGDWTASVTLNQPLFFRTGNASLIFVFETYEAVVFPKSSPSPIAMNTTADDPPQNETTNETGPQAGSAGHRAEAYLQARPGDPSTARTG